MPTSFLGLETRSTALIGTAMAQREHRQECEVKGPPDFTIKLLSPSV